MTANDIANMCEEEAKRLLKVAAILRGLKYTEVVSVKFTNGKKVEAPK